MTLAVLVQKNGLRQLATLTVATAATGASALQEVVANVASVTVATAEITDAFLEGTATGFRARPTLEPEPEAEAQAEAFDGWPVDDRRHCAACAQLSGGRCLAAWRGEIKAAKRYRPVDDLPRRCEGYAPKTHDPDQRTGKERWPRLGLPRA